MTLYPPANSRERHPEAANAHDDPSLANGGDIGSNSRWIAGRPTHLAAVSFILACAVLARYIPLYEVCTFAFGQIDDFAFRLIDKFVDLLLAALLLWLLMTFTKLPAAFYGLRWKPGHDVLVGAVVGVALAASFQLVGLLLRYFGGPPPFAPHTAAERMEYSLIFLFSVPAEELLYRAALIPHLREAVRNAWITVTLGGAAFALAHYGVSTGAMAGAFFMGCVWAALFLKVRSVLAVTLAHWIFNEVQLLTY